MSDDPIVRIENKIDKLSDRMSSIDVTLAAQHVSLKDHIRRTSLLEGAVIPMQAHVSRVEGAIKFIGFISVLAVIFETALQAITFIGSIK